jgi:hypothetical protein
LRDLLGRAEQARVPVAVVGSVALAVRGVDVRPGDIDVLTTLEGTDALGEAFTGGIRVEWLGTAARVQEGSWPLNAAEWSVASPFDEIWWENRSVRVPPLELQRRVEVQRQRLDRVAAIDAFTRGRRDGSRR